jgi:hypothetical protein
MAFERIKPPGPLRSVRLEPLVELHQWFGTKPVQPSLRIPANLHQARVAQHLEMSRHTGLVHTNLADQLVHRPLALADRVEDPPSCRFSDHLEDRQLSRHGPSIYQSIYMCNRMRDFMLDGGQMRLR